MGCGASRTGLRKRSSDQAATACASSVSPLSKRRTSKPVPKDSSCVAVRSISMQPLELGNMANTGHSHQNVRSKPFGPRLNGRYKRYGNAAVARPGDELTTGTFTGKAPSSQSRRHEAKTASADSKRCARPTATRAVGRNMAGISASTGSIISKPLSLSPTELAATLSAAEAPQPQPPRN